MTLFEKICLEKFRAVPLAEYQFATPRKWRFDWAWPERKIALECQGGIFKQGRHTRGAALLKEHEKLNEAVILGWRVLFTTPKDMENGNVFALLERALA